MPMMKATAMNQPDIQTIIRLVDDIKPILAGHSPVVQSAVLADLLAIWLLCFSIGPRTADLRDELLKKHVGIVQALVAEAEK